MSANTLLYFVEALDQHENRFDRMWMQACIDDVVVNVDQRITLAIFAREHGKQDELVNNKEKGTVPFHMKGDN